RSPTRRWHPATPSWWSLDGTCASVSRRVRTKASPGCPAATCSSNSSPADHRARVKARGERASASRGCAGRWSAGSTEVDRLTAGRGGDGVSSATTATAPDGRRYGRRREVAGQPTTEEHDEQDAMGRG